MSCLGCRKDGISSSGSCASSSPAGGSGSPSGSNNQNRNCTSNPPTYEDYMRFANALGVTLRRPEDREYFDDILKNCQRIYDSGNPNARKYIREFLSYFLKVLHKNSSTQPLEVYEQWYNDSGQIQKSRKMRIWLEADKSFFQMEKTSEGGILFYAAIATDPSAGWDKGGLKNL